MCILKINEFSKICTESADKLAMSAFSNSNLLLMKILIKFKLQCFYHKKEQKMKDRKVLTLQEYTYTKFSTKQRMLLNY